MIVEALSPFAAVIIIMIFGAGAVLETEALPKRFLSAVTFEATGMMGCLFLASVFLGWLYDPETQEA